MMRISSSPDLGMLSFLKKIQDAAFGRHFFMNFRWSFEVGGMDK
jgi:hypothetical protein